MTAIVMLGAGGVVTILCFAIFWLTDARISWENDITFREWWKNRPVLQDPDRWERFSESRR